MIQPIGDRLLVKQSKKESPVGIITTVSPEDNKLPQGKVIKVSSTVNVEGLEEGVTVYFNEYGGERIKIDEEDYLILNLSDILGINIC